MKASKKENKEAEPSNELKSLMEQQKNKQNANVGFIQQAIKNNLRSQLTDPDVDQDYAKLMDQAEKQLNE